MDGPGWVAAISASENRVGNVTHVPGDAQVLAVARLLVRARRGASVGMPATGKWAYNVPVAPVPGGAQPYSDKTSSHPSVHHTPARGDWSTDVYPSAGAAVKLHVDAAGGTLSFKWAASSTSCGQSTRVNILLDGKPVGWVYYAHIDRAVTSGKIFNGVTLGRTATFTRNGKVCNRGRHVHIEVKGAEARACYVDYHEPGSRVLDAGMDIARLGATGITKRATRCRVS